MQREWMPYWLIVVFLFVIAQDIAAAPHHGDTFELSQPNGTMVPVRIWGDEFHQDVESLEGHTLVRDPETGWIQYADVDSRTGDLIPTQTRYGQGKRAPHSRKGLRADRKLVQKIRRAKQQALGYDEWISQGPWTAPSQTQLPEGISPAPAEPRRVMGLTILVNFPDQKSTFTQQDVYNFCNQVGYTANSNKGSIFEYYRDVSNGWLLYNNIVTAWVTVDKNKSYYDSGPGYGHVEEFITNALTKLQSQTNLDLSELTLNNGRAMALNIFYAGSASAGWAEGLWAHQGSYTGTTAVQGIRFRSYQMAGMGTGMSIGTFIHENGHMIMRWPDLYSYESPIHNNGVGRYCIMSSINQTNPIIPNPYFRQLAGWIDVEDIAGRAIGTQYSNLANSFSVFRYLRDSNEFYLMEARRREGRSATLPAEGLAIWHVHKEGDNTSADAGFPLVALIQADGMRHLETKGNTGDANDFYKSTGNSRFNASTNPSAKWHDGTNATIDIAEISAVAPTMTFKIGSTAAVTTYGLSVVGGQGSGSYSPGQVVPIIAPDSGASGSFVRWTSTNLNIANPVASATTVVMANASATVTANFQLPQVIPGTLTAKSAGYAGAVQWNTDVATMNESSVLEWVVRVAEPGLYRLRWSTGSASTGSAILQNLGTSIRLDTLQGVNSGNKGILLDAGTFKWRLTGSTGVVHFKQLSIERAYTLAVEGGTGAGQYVPGESVVVDATSPVNFFRWHSQGMDLEYPYESSLQFLMANSNVTLHSVTAVPYAIPGRIQAEAYHYHSVIGTASSQIGQNDQGLRMTADQSFVAYKLGTPPDHAVVKMRVNSFLGSAVLVLRFNDGWSDTLYVTASNGWTEQNSEARVMDANADVLEAQVIQGELDLDWLDFEVPLVNISKSTVKEPLSLQGIAGGLVYTLPQKSNVKIQIRDIHGNLIQKWNLGSQESGAHTLKLNANLDAGVYWVQLRAGQSVRTMRVVHLQN